MVSRVNLPCVAKNAKQYEEAKRTVPSNALSLGVETLMT